MSNSSLLLSLLANSSANPRSSSLMLKNNLIGSFTATARSSSISNSRSDGIVKKQNRQQNTILVKLNHLLNVKVKNNYYFFFCKLENNFKKIKELIKKEVANSQLITSIDVKMNLCQSLKQQKLVYNKENIAHFCDTFNTFASKREIILQKQHFKNGFLRLKRISKKKKSVKQIYQVLLRLKKDRQRVIFNYFYKIEKNKIRNQILQISLTNIITKYLAQKFNLIKVYSNNSIKEEKKLLQSINKIQYLQKSEQKMSKKNVKQDQQLIQSGQKTNRGKKILLKEKKILTSRPICLPHLKTKTIQISDDKPFDIKGQLNIDKKMTTNLNVKPDFISSCMPDFGDNGHIFGQFEMTYSSIPINTVYTIEIYNTQTKQTNDLDSNICLTDRSKPQPCSSRCLSKSSKNTPKHSKDKSINFLNKKEVYLDSQQNSQSPLAKIDQILNKIEQMKNYGVQKSNQKKMVNVNLSKQICQSHLNQHNSIKYRKKTPIKKIEEKQNMPQRLITERQTGSKRKSSNGLQNGVKYKSTILQKGKEKQGPISTAKKMKMEIENIINRRNKQLYRAESTQLN